MKTKSPVSVKWNLWRYYSSCHLSSQKLYLCSLKHLKTFTTPKTRKCHLYFNNFLVSIRPQRKLQSNATTSELIPVLLSARIKIIGDNLTTTMEWNVGNRVPKFKTRGNFVVELLNVYDRGSMEKSGPWRGCGAIANCQWRLVAPHS